MLRAGTAATGLTGLGVETVAAEVEVEVAVEVEVEVVALEVAVEVAAMALVEVVGLATTPLKRSLSDDVE